MILSDCLTVLVSIREYRSVCSPLPIPSREKSALTNGTGGETLDVAFVRPTFRRFQNAFSSFPVLTTHCSLVRGRPDHPGPARGGSKELPRPRWGFPRSMQQPRV